MGALAAAVEARERGKGLVMHGKISALATGLVPTEDVGGGCSAVASKIAKAMRVIE